MKYKLLIAIMLGFFLIGNVIALEEMGTFKQGSTINVTQVCSNATYITLTSVAYPNSSLAISQINMTSLGNGEFYYTFTNTSTIGRYDVRGISDGCEKTFATYFEVTPSGFVGTLGFYIIILILSLGIIILGYGIEDAWVVVLGAFGFVLFGLFVLLYGIDGIKDTYYTWGIGIITIMTGAYFGIRGSLEQIGDIGEL
jgi:hypothetical protein